MTTAPRFSVIMNVFNGERYLNAAIDSVFAQHCPDWELIIWNDCSTDASEAICKQYDDPRVRYFPSPVRSQIGQARNLAIRQARGQWLAFLDQDDVWSPDKLAGQQRLIEAHNDESLAIVYGRTRVMAEGRKGRDFDRWHEFRTLPEGDIFPELVDKPSFISLSSAVLRTRAVRELGDIPEHVVYCPDYYLFLMLAQQYRAACLQETCCWYRVHDTNMSRFYKIRIHSEILNIIQGCSRPVGQTVLRRRRKVHNTLISLEEIVSGQAPWNGLIRLFTEGSLLYLLARPYLYSYRNLRRNLISQ